QAEDGIRDSSVTGVQTCALPILPVDQLVVPHADRLDVRERQRVVSLRGTPEPASPFEPLVQRRSRNRLQQSEHDDRDASLLQERSEERRVGEEARRGSMRVWYTE